MMLRDARVEPVGRQLFPGCQQAEAFAGYDPMEITLLRANRTVAFEQAIDLALDLISDAPAMASTLFQAPSVLGRRARLHPYPIIDQSVRIAETQTGQLSS